MDYIRGTGLKYGTVKSRLKRANPDGSVDNGHQRQQIMSKIEEQTLVDCINDLLDAGKAVSKTDMIELGYEILRARGSNTKLVDG
ncbi:MAG: hypothetical protein M5F18_04580 [Asgard group archaeon]|nr:hypothetical protein [Asgard group archaeon]